MGVKLDKRTSDRLRDLRKERLLSQEELRQKAKVSLRTVQNLESGNRQSFSESTLIALCRALDISYDSLWADDEVWAREVMDVHLTVQQAPSVRDETATGRSSINETNNETNAARNWSIAAFAFALLVVGVVLVLVVNQQQLLENLSADLNPAASNGFERTDWVEKHEVFLHDVIEPGHYDWDEKIAEVDRFRAYNHIDYNKTPLSGDSIHVEMQWVWYYASGNPEVYISCYGKWDPDTEIRVFNGDLTGEGMRVDFFTLPPPPTIGPHFARVFYAEAFAPVPSYYGSPPPGQVTDPSFAPYVELWIEVLPKP